MKLIPLFLIICLSFALSSCSQREGPPAEVVMHDQPKPPIHIVKKGESLTSIARLYNVNKQSIIDTNKLKRPYRLVVGQRLIINSVGHNTSQVKNISTPNYSSDNVDDSGVEISSIPSAPPVGFPDPSLPNPGVSASKGLDDTPLVTAADLDATDSYALKSGMEQKKQPSSSGGKLKKPVAGKTISSFNLKGNNPNDGINIAAPKGTPVLASDAGTVAFAGPTDQGFGNVVIVKHGNDLLTVYAHLDEALVKKDAVVTKGQKIGKVGLSGPVKQPQLHFEVRKNSQPIDPEKMF